MGLITFNSSSEIVSDFTNDIVNLTEKINDLSTTGSTSYYRALENVDKILKEYQREENRECKVLFITTTNPSLDIPNEVAYYEYLKKQYPFITINGIQYEMGSIVMDSLKKITDSQYVADSNTLNNVLLKAASSPISYDKFTITDYIDTNYFNVESKSSISVNQGNIILDKDNQTIRWNLDNFKSGNKAKMMVKASLKTGLSSGVYPTSTKTHIESKIGEVIEDEDNTNTPILANNYRVIYDGSAPAGCSVEGLPKVEFKSILEVVGVSNVIPKCEGYQFKGWKLITKDVSKINDDYFMMPEEDVIFKATWGKVAVKKLMDGKVSSASSDLEKGDIILDLSNNQTETLDVSKITNMATEVADENIASINAEGIITGKNIGNTTITVRGDNDYLKEYKVSVQKTVTVTYEKQGIGVTGITKEKDSCLITKSGESCKAVAPKMTVLPGYEVAGWNTDMNSREGVKSGDIINLSEDATYYSIFYKEAATYSVNFNANGNAISDTKQSCSIDRVYNGSTEGINCSITTPVITAPSSTPTVIGYNEDKSETDSQIGSGETLVLNESNTGKTYYAITKKDGVTYKADFNANGNTIDATSKSCSIEATYNGKAQATGCFITTPTITASSATPTIIGYNEDKNATTSQLGSNEKVTLNSANTGKTYYAITKKDGATYTVNFNANGNTIDATSKSCSIDTVYNGTAQAASCNITTPVITSPSATPTIIGYNEDKNATTSQVGSNATLAVNSTNNGKTYYAITKKDGVTYTNYFNANGNTIDATSKSCSIEATYNGKVQVTDCSITTPKITAPSATPTIIGYNEDKNATTSQIGSNEEIILNSATTGKTYYAITKKAGSSYTVNFAANGNTIAATSKSCSIATAYNGTTQANSCNVTTPVITAPSATPTIVGYNQTSSATTSQVGSNATLAVNSTNNGKTYYAITKKDGVSYNAKFNANGNTINATSKSCSIEATYNGVSQATSCNIATPVITAPSATPTIVGYNQTASATTSQVGSNATLVINSTNNGKTYYAITKKDGTSYTVNFAANGNTINATSKSCSIATVYNGTTQATSCNVTTPVITAPSATPTIVGYNQTASATTSQVGSNATLAVNSTNNGKTYYAITKKDGVTYTNYFNANGNTIDATSKSCSIEATYNGKVQVTDCSITTPKITAPSATPTIVGYNQTASATTSQVGSNATLVINSTNNGKTYYAITKKNGTNYTVNFNANGNTVSATSKSCSIATVYNGTTQANSCNVTTPVITAPSATPTVIGYNQTASATSSQVGSNTTLTVTSANNGKTYYAITRKNAITRSITYTKGKGVSATGKASDSCTIAATYNGVAQTATSCNITLPSITTGVGYTTPAYYANTGGTGTKYAASSSYTLSGNATLYAVAKRNFTCATRGNTTSYAGKNWYTLANDGTNCYLALNAISSSTGTYAERTTKLTSEYFTSGSTLLAEKNAALISEIDSYSGNEGVSTASVWWAEGGGVISYRTFPYYEPRYTGLNVGSTHANLGGDIVGVADGFMGTIKDSITSYQTNTTRNCDSVSGANCIIYNGKVSGGVSNHGSTSFSRFSFPSSSEGSTTSFKISHRNYPVNNNYSFSQYVLYIKPCGGSYHNSNIYKMTAKSKTQVTHYNYSNQNTSTINKKGHTWDVSGVASSTTESVTKGTKRVYNTGSHSSCVPIYNYTFSNASYPIYYRLLINVKM